MTKVTKSVEPKENQTPIGAMRVGVQSVWSGGWGDRDRPRPARSPFDLYL
ncbi:hypothetical protein [Oxynema sp. CENA135]|nr:hypothetical protein [Oxynema sp. CENA135]